MLTIIFIFIGIFLVVYFLPTDYGTNEQSTKCFCSCGNELISSNSFVSDTYDFNDKNHVIYKCKMCGVFWDYNFDIAPAPIHWDVLQDKDEVGLAWRNEQIRLFELKEGNE